MTQASWYLSAAFLALAVQTAYAQDTADRASAGSAEPGGSALGDIIVTARRTSENQQSVPVAVTALQPEVLARNNITSVQDVARIVPSFSTFGPYTV